MSVQSLPSEWIGRLFSRFQAIYGNKVATMWGEADPSEVRDVWGEQLGRFEGSDIRYALDVCLSAYPDYPPTLPQFLGLCVDGRRRRAQEAVKLPGPKTEIPPHIAKMLREFVERARV